MLLGSTNAPQTGVGRECLHIPVLLDLVAHSYLRYGGNIAVVSAANGVKMERAV